MGLVKVCCLGKCGNSQRDGGGIWPLRPASYNCLTSAPVLLFFFFQRKARALSRRKEGEEGEAGPRAGYKQVLPAFPFLSSPPLNTLNSMDTKDGENEG